MNDTAVIIPCYLIPDKGSELTRFTRDCIASLRAHMPGVLLVIVDNGSTVDDDYLAAVANVYIRNSDNLGFAKAVNQGLQAALYHGCDWLIVSNNDIVFLDDWAAQAKAAWQKNTGIISSHLHDHDPEHKVGRQLATVGLMFGALWMVHRQTINIVDMLDIGYERGMFEDKDWFQRIHEAGMDLIKSGWCRHIGNATWGKLPHQYEIYVKNMERYQAKWGEA